MDLWCSVITSWCCGVCGGGAVVGVVWGCGGGAWRGVVGGGLGLGRRGWWPIGCLGVGEFSRVEEVTVIRDDGWMGGLEFGGNRGLRSKREVGRKIKRKR